MGYGHTTSELRMIIRWKNKPKLEGSSIWWDIEGPIHYEFMHPDQNITAYVYYDQLSRLDAKIKETRPV